MLEYYTKHKGVHKLYRLLISQLPILLLLLLGLLREEVALVLLLLVAMPHIACDTVRQER